MSIAHALFWLGLISGPAPDYAYLPSRVRIILESKSTTTSQVEWTLSWFGSYNDGLVERHITRTSDETIWESNLGDEKGQHNAAFYHWPGPNATEEQLRREMVPKELVAGIRNKLIYDDRAWYIAHAERPLSGYASPAAKTTDWLPSDLKSIGLAPYEESESDANPLNLYRDDFEGFEKSTFRDGWESGYPTVTAEWGDRRALTWRFDDRRGGQPVQASFYRFDKLVNYSQTEYERAGERWFPKSVRFYREDSASPYKIIDVQRATFDEPWHMKEITPSDIGALAGTQFLGADGLSWWTGTDLIPNDDFLELLYLDDSIMDQRIAEMMVEGTKQTVDEYRGALRRAGVALREQYRKKYGEDFQLTKLRPDEKDEWDVYVEKFIAEHKLPEPGIKRANEIRDSAKKLRDAHRLKNSAELKKARKSGDKKKIAEFESVEKRIFERMLERPLQKLPRMSDDAKKDSSAPPP